MCILNLTLTKKANEHNSNVLPVYSLLITLIELMLENADGSSVRLAAGQQLAQSLVDSQFVLLRLVLE